MFKKILIRLGVLLFIVLAVVGIRYLNNVFANRINYSSAAETAVDNSELKQITGSGYQVVAENDYLKLQLNFDDGNIIVTNKSNGYEWRSCPTDEEISLESSNDLWKNNLRSPIVYTYINDVAQSDAAYGNVYGQNCKISVFELEGGVRVFFEFTDTKITLAYDLILAEDHMEVSVPANLISDTGVIYTKSDTKSTVIDTKNTFLLVDFMIFPFFGAVLGDSDTKGYIFVPDGIGGLMDFSVKGNELSQYIGHVYGSDLALLNNYDRTIYSEMNRTYINYPVYGMVRDQNSVFTIIDQGETQADIIASKKGVQTGFHTVSSRFNYRLRYKLVTNTVTGDGYFTYTDFNISDSRKLLYYFNSGSSASYVEMAKCYRNYLIKKNDIDIKKPAETADPLQLYIVGGDIKENLVGTSFLTATTFDQAKDILQYFKDQGIGDIDVILDGWSKKGMSVTYPNRFPVPSKLGGDDGLTSFGSFAHEIGYKFYLQDDFFWLNSKKGVSIRKDTVYNIQDNSILEGAYPNIAFSKEQIEDTFDRYQKYGIDGIEDLDLGWFLYSDFNKRNVMSRADMMEGQISLAEELVDKYGSVRLTRPSAYLVRDNVHFSSFVGSNYYNIIDETVPFYSIVLHGVTGYDMGSYNNGFYEPDNEFLKTIEYGGDFYFELTMQPTSELLFGESSFFYSTEFNLWKDKIAALYKRYQTFSEATAGKFIDNYEKPAKDIVKVTYEGGVTVLINYSATDYSYEGVTVPANDFVVVK